jgi:citrate lyase beta subunit
MQHAANVIHAAEKARNEGSGVAVVRGKMIDRPVLERAEALMNYAERLEVVVPAPTI